MRNDRYVSLLFIHFIFAFSIPLVFLLKLCENIFRLFEHWLRSFENVCAGSLHQTYLSVHVILVFFRDSEENIFSVTYIMFCEHLIIDVTFYVRCKGMSYYIFFIVEYIMLKIYLCSHLHVNFV